MTKYLTKTEWIKLLSSGPKLKEDIKFRYDHIKKKFDDEFTFNEYDQAVIFLAEKLLNPKELWHTQYRFTYKSGL